MLYVVSVWYMWQTPSYCVNGSSSNTNVQVTESSWTFESSGGGGGFLPVRYVPVRYVTYNINSNTGFYRSVTMFLSSQTPFIIQQFSCMLHLTYQTQFTSSVALIEYEKIITLLTPYHSDVYVT